MNEPEPLDESEEIPQAYAPGMQLRIAKDGSSKWCKSTVTKTKFDFPRAKEGGPQTLEFDIGDRHPGKPRRLDKYLIERFPGYSRSFLQKMIKDLRVLIDGHSVKASWHVSAGEHVSVILFPGGAKVAEDIPFKVVFEDEHILALIKPSGVLVHPARGHKTGTLYNGLLHYFREKRGADPSYHIGTVHRLDEQTSGIMIYALCPKAHGELTRQFENRLVRKTYLCLVHGRASFTETTITAPLGTDPDNMYRVAVDGIKARSAETKYIKLAESLCGEFSLLRAFPHTGRTHQIRVHAAALGHPLVGDPLYGGLKEHPSFGGIIARVCLHAETLSIQHPSTGEPMLLSAPLPDDFVAILEQVGIKDGREVTRVAATEIE
ncbi:MAG: RluA family pseudouridine synthase [Planctomycetota bacterium]